MSFHDPVSQRFPGGFPDSISLTSCAVIVAQRVVSINVATRRRALIVDLLGWVTVGRRVNRIGM